MKIFTQVIFIIVLSFFSYSLFAATPVLDKRQDNQKHRINKGVKNGDLTVRETNNLRNGQKKLKRQERKAKSDGKVTMKERARLQHNTNKLSAKIKKKKNNNRKRN